MQCPTSMSRSGIATGIAFALALAIPGFAISDDDRRTGSAKGSAEARTATVSQSTEDARREGFISATFATSDHLRWSDIDVKVRGSQATLNGSVESHVEKDLAEQIALSVSGIERVDNQLHVDATYARTPPRDGERSFGDAVADAAVTAQVKSKLLWNRNTDGLDINVDTREGRVTLKGEADSTASRELAERLAKNTNNVVAVDNQLRVVPDDTRTTGTVSRDVDRRPGESQQPVADTWITTKVKSTLLFSRSVGGTGVEVETRNGVVLLSGEVESGAEKELAVELAKDIRGVREVDASALAVTTQRGSARDVARN
jgi:hyperosmotically inducible periplasmic protein